MAGGTIWAQALFVMTDQGHCRFFYLNEGKEYTILSKQLAFFPWDLLMFSGMQEFHWSNQEFPRIYYPYTESTLSGTIDCNKSIKCSASSISYWVGSIIYFLFAERHFHQPCGKHKTCTRLWQTNVQVIETLVTVANNAIYNILICACISI